MFGIGAGKAEVKLAKTSFSPGETIEGKLFITVKHPTKANGVIVKLYAEQQFREMSGGKMRTVVRRVYEFPLQLDSAREYSPTGQPLSYDFKIKIPENAAASNAAMQPSGALGGVLSLLGGVGGGATGPAKWFVEGQLDIPMGLDVKGRVQISI